MGKRIAYVGPAGNHTEEAALLYASSEDLTPFPSITEVGEAVLSGEFEEGVVPIESSTNGSVNATVDLLIREKLFIREEIVIPVLYNLVARPGTRVNDVKIVYSDPDGFAQCGTFVRRDLASVKQKVYPNAAAAVCGMKESRVPAAAIAPARAAELNGARIVAHSIQDSPVSDTRFVVLAKADHEPTGDDKTSLCFTFAENKPGLLHNAVAVFAERKINLAKIESRPTKQALGTYIFLVDCHGHREDPLMKDALADLEDRVGKLVVLGSYPKFQDGAKV